jgi:glycosyltransferase involved in cell wall biosynthesis
MHFCTIVARNYLAYAEVLMAGVTRHHPEADRTVVVVDAVPGEELRTDLATLLLDDLPLDPGELDRLRSIYDVTELCTAVKPSALTHLLDAGAEVACYLDPDIVVHAPLVGLEERARAHDVVLTPHVLAPMPDDGLGITERTILLSGVFNLGFVAVGSRSRPFLGFWDERLRRHCLVDHGAGLFTDQRWIDLAPALFDVAVVRDPGWNVAYWNLHERPLRLTAADVASTGGPHPYGTATVGDGVPLVFYHHSGHDPADGSLLSKHQGDRPRILLSEHPDVTSLCARWRDDLDAAGHGRRRRTPYRWAATAGGVALTTPVRHCLRDALLAVEATGGERPPSPIGADDGTAFVAWCLGTDDDDGPTATGDGTGVGVPRLVRWLHRTRADLQAAFPRVPGSDAAALVHWAATDAALRGDVAIALLPDPPPPVTLVSPATTAPASPTPGFNVVGYLEAELGVGESGRLVVRAAEAAGLPVATRAERRTSSRQRHGFGSRGAPGLPHDTTVLAVNADRVGAVLDALPTAEQEGRRRIGFWYWEVDVLPDPMRRAFDRVDEVWVASRYVADVLRPLSDTPVRRFPLPVLWPETPTALTRADVGVPADRFTFLYVFDFFSVFERKNPLGVVGAYTRAFGPDDGAALVLKTINGDRCIHDLERLRLAVAGRPDIEVRTEYLPAAHLRALTERSDAYVSLHRSEGFGLTIAQAMAAGTPAVATAHSGNLDFMTPAVSVLVPATLRAVGPGCDPYPRHATWAEPDLDAAADAMRALADDPAAARRLGGAGRAHVRAHHGIAPAAAFLRAHFDAPVTAADVVRSRAGGSARHVRAGARASSPSGDAG